MSLSERFTEYVRAGFAGIWIQSYEHDEAIGEIGKLCQARNWRLATWDVDQGMRVQGAGSAPVESASDPLAAIRSASALKSSDGAAILILENLHRFMNSIEVVQALDRQITQGKAEGVIVVVLSAVVQIPVELQKLFVVLDHDLPGREELRQLAASLATEAEELPVGNALERLLDAAGGLTRYEAENAFSLSLVRKQRIDADAVWELKTQTLQKSGLLSLHRGGDSFAAVGGLSSLKQFCLRALQPSNPNSCVRPRGVLLLGVPGVGKSAVAKALGNEVGRPTLVLDVGALMGSLVGQTEQNIRQALRIVDAMAPCILFCDEIEKALAGSQGGANDSGVSARLFGSLLTWLNDHTTDVFFIATSNDVSKLPPEFTRAERFDGVFFLDLPSSTEKAAIWRMYIAKYELDASQIKPKDTDWTGAEIKACCRLAALLDVPLIEAAQNVVPIAITSAESVDRLRTWATARCLSADAPGIYRRVEATVTKIGRKIAREPLLN